MLIYKLITLGQNEICIKNPISVSVKIDKDAPANSLELSFTLSDELYSVFSKGDDEFTRVELYDDDLSLITDMLIDEHKIYVSSQGITSTIYARSRASLLLDNEAKPAEYSKASLNMMFLNHAKPYGFNSYIGTNRVFYSSFEITKGSSEWKALESFAKNFSYKTPRLTLKNVLDFNLTGQNKSICFSNKTSLASTQSYESLEYTYKRSAYISQVYIKRCKGGDYDSLINNSTALSKGIIRNRFINMSNELNQNYKAEQKIKTSSENAMKIALLCRGALLLDIFDIVSLDDDILGKIEGLSVSGVHYKLDKSGERTQITLYKAT